MFAVTKKPQWRCPLLPNQAMLCMLQASMVEATVKLIDVPVVTLGHIYYRGLDTAVQLMDR